MKGECIVNLKLLVFLYLLYKINLQWQWAFLAWTCCFCNTDSMIFSREVSLCFSLLFMHVNAHNQDEISLFHMVTSKLMVYFENEQVEEMLNSECTKWTNGLIAL